MSEPEVKQAVAGGGRHRGREIALQVLYAIDLGVPEPVGDEEETDDGAAADVVVAPEAAAADRSFDRIVENFDVPASAIEFAHQLVAAVVEHANELDVLLGVHARNWRVSRMAAVDRNVLRLAVYELLHTQTPIAVVIDEAVDLGRRFGSDSSPAFVNGVLDAVAREVRAA